MHVAEEGYERHYLSIGDEFCLQTIPDKAATVGFVSAKKVDGKLFCDFLDGTNITRTHPDRPIFSRFTLRTADQYSASKELQKWEADLKSTDLKQKEKLVALDAAEDKINQSEYRLAVGIDATFGGVYQLLNTSSSQFLQIQKTTSDEDSTALRASLADGTTRGKVQWFRIKPGFRTRNEGEKVRMGDTVVLESVKMQKMYVHCDMQTNGRTCAEVNCYDKPTRFKIVPVSKATEVSAVEKMNGICAGSFVEIYRRQSSSYVYRQFTTDTPSLLTLDGAAEDGAEDAIPVAKLRADLLFQLNIPSMAWSGEGVLCDPRSRQQFSLRDAISGRFIIEKNQSLSFSDTDDSIEAMWSLVPFEAEAEGPMLLLQAEKDQFWIKNVASGNLLCESDLTTDDERIVPLSCLPKELVAEADLFVLRAVPSAWMGQFFTLMQGIAVMQSFLKDIQNLQENPSKHEVKVLIESHLRSYMKPNSRKMKFPWSGPLTDVVEHILLNLTSSSNTDLLSRDGVLNEDLQHQLTEARVLPFVVEELLPALFDKISPQVVQSEVHGSYLLNTVRLLFRLIWGMAKQSAENSLWLFRKMDFLMSFIDNGFNTANIINVVFEDNEKLMRKAETPFIENMLRLAVEQQAVRYLSFLTVILDFKGRPLKSNQDRVSELVKTMVPPSMFTIDVKTASESSLAFHTSLVRLATLLCAGRHRESIDWFLQEAGFSYREMLFRMFDPNISFSCRNAYTRLMQNLFVDREPYEIHSATQTNRIIPSLRGLTTAQITKRLGAGPSTYVDAYDDLGGKVLRPTAGFQDLKDEIFKALGSISTLTASEFDKNNYVQAIIELAQLMLSFGLYDNQFDINSHDDGTLLLGEESIRLGEKLLLLLDGRTDVMGDLEPDGDMPARFRIDLQETATIMALKTSTISLLQDLFGLRASSKIDVLITRLGTSDWDSSGDSAPANASPSAPAASFEVEDYKNPLSDQQSPKAASEPVPVAKLADSASICPKRLKIAEEAMNDAGAVRVFTDSTAETLLVGCLLDTLRYNQHVDLCLSAFDTLVMFSGRNVTFCQTIKKVKILGTDAAARDFLRAMEQVSEFRRLRKWLHLRPQCDRNIELCSELGDWCKTPFGQNMLRDLNLEMYIVRVLSIRIEGPLFVKLVKACLILIAKFCRENETNQHSVAQYLTDGLFMKLLWDPQYYEATAVCLMSLVKRNEHLSIVYSGQLTSTVGQLASSPKHGRKMALLLLLEQLLIYEDHPIEPSQLQVCKGAMVSRNLVETVGDLDKDEYGDGKAMSNEEVILCYLAAPDSTDGARCKSSLEYYAKSIVVLGICARGKMPTTELLCASLISFDECILRIWKLCNVGTMMEKDPWHLESGDNDSDLIITVKCSLLTFFREVFVDTNSENILMSLRRPKNLLWVEDEPDEASAAVAMTMFQDLQQLLDFEMNGIKSTPAHQGGYNAAVARTSARRVYLFEEVIMFFIQYGRVIGPSGAAEEEVELITSTYSSIVTICQEAQKFNSWTAREQILLKQLIICASDYARGVDPSNPTLLEDNELAKASHEPFVEEILDVNATKWAEFAKAAISTVPVQHVKGTERLVGMGVMQLAKDLWQQAYDGDSGEPVEMGNYVNFLINPTFVKLEEIRESRILDDIPKMLTIFDTVRAVPFVASGYTAPKLADAFRRFCQVVPLNGGANPDVSSVQFIMVREGWALLCFNVLSATELSPLHLPCLRLLLALTGGSSAETKDELLNQLIGNESGSGIAILSEVFASSCRRCLRAAISDIKLQRKQVDGGIVAETGYAQETMSVMVNLCEGHEGMQSYMMDQIGHDETFDLVSDIVTYLSQLERDIKTSCIQNPGKLIGGSDAVVRAQSALAVLRAMSSGPHAVNQVHIGTSDIAPIINRIMAYTDYTSVADVDMDHHTLKTPKGACNMAIARLLLALLEGQPQATVVTRLIATVDWHYIATHMRTMKTMIEEGILQPSDQSSSSKGKKGKKKPVETSVPTPLPDYIVNLKSGRVVEWLNRESFQFFSIIEKLRIAGTELSKLPKYHDHLLDPMLPVLSDVATSKFFSQRVGQVQVVRNDSLENLFFPMPELQNDREESMIDSMMCKYMETAPREDSTQKLQYLLEGMTEIVANIESNKLTSELAGKRLPKFFDWCQRKQPTMYFSLILCSLCAVSYDHDSSSTVFGTTIKGWSLDPNTFDRIPIVAEYFGFFSVLHLTISIIKAYGWIRIRFPVLNAMYKRSARLTYLREPHQGIPGARDDLIARSIVVHGLPNEIDGYELSTFSVTRYFSRFGPCAGARVVPIEPEEGSDADSNVSWALVVFDTSTGKVKALAQQDKTGGYLKAKGFVSKKKQNLASLNPLDLMGFGEKSIDLFVMEITEDYVAASPTLTKLVDSCLLDLLIIKSDMLFAIADEVQQKINRIPYGYLIPVTTLYVFKTDPELIDAAADIIMSLIGGLVHPLAYTFHLFKLLKTQGAVIVVTSMTQNVERLALTIGIALLFAWVFAISGLLYFKEFHKASTVDNPGGPCANLLTCFFSYSYATLMQSGLGTWITSNDFPVNASDVTGIQFQKSLWETTFAMCAMFVVSIITGIICDTFGELRGEQDEAKDYRLTNNFITNIPYATVPEEKSTHHMQYAKLALHLARRRESQISPLERMVRDKNADGDIGWIPDERCIATEIDKQDYVEAQLKALMERMGSIESMLEADQLERLENEQQSV